MWAGRTWSCVASFIKTITFYGENDGDDDDDYDGSGGDDA